jgi:cell wall-associated NlpC family hydrolase
MKQAVCVIVLSACVAAQAAPAVAPDDEIGRFAVEQGWAPNAGLLEKLGQVRQNVSNSASELVLTAMGFLGVPYRRGGSNAESGFDCSGFVKAMYETTLGWVLPRRAEQQAAATRTIDRKDLQPGDLVFFNTMKHAFSHVGIYVGENKFIHSPKPGAQVRLEDMGQSYWQARFDGARRVLSMAPAEPAPAQP